MKADLIYGCTHYLHLLYCQSNYGTTEFKNDIIKKGEANKGKRKR
jgi:hypothetical protein